MITNSSGLWQQLGISSITCVQLVCNKTIFLFAFKQSGETQTYWHRDVLVYAGTDILSMVLQLHAHLGKSVWSGLFGFWF